MKKKKDYFFWNLQNTAEQLAFCDKKIIIFFFKTHRNQALRKEQNSQYASKNNIFD